MDMTLVRRLLPGMLLLLVTATARAGIAVEGKVLGPDGQGLAGARVEVRPVLRVYEQGVRDLEGRGEPGPVASTTTETGGWYRIEAPREGVWRVLIAARGFVTMESGPMALTGETPLLDASMKPDAGLLVRVQGADGKPVAGARVAAQPGSRVPWTQEWRPEDRAGVSGADGTLRLSRAKEETLRLSALAPGHAPGRADSRDPGSLTLRLPRARRWTLWIYSDRKPVADALVRDAASLLPVGRTDAEGVLIMDAPAAGPWALRVDTRDGRLASFEVPEIPQTPAQDRPRTLILPPLVPLTARVVDRMDGRPVPGALVWPLTDPAAFVRTDASGSFRLAWTSNTWVWLQAERTGYFYNQGSFFPDTEAATAPSIVLQPSGFLAGAAVDERGQPVAGAEVRLLHEGEDLRRVRSSPRGRFRLPHLHPGATYELLAVAPGLAPARETVTLAETGRPDLRLVLGRSRTVLGQVVDETGKPVAGAKVELVRNLSAEVRPEAVEGFSAEDGLYQAETGSEGRFEILGLPAGWFDLEVRGAGFVPLTVRGIELASEPGPERKQDLGTVALRQGATVEGRAVDPAGRPIPEAQVWVVPDEDAGERVWKAFREAGPAATTGPDGRFVLSGIDPGRSLTVDVCRPGYLTATLWPEVAADDPIKAVLQPAARLSGRVVDPEGQPVAGARAGAYMVAESLGDVFPPERPCRHDEANQSGETDAEGRFTLEGLQEGTFELWAMAEGHLRAEVDEWEVKPGKEGAEPTLVLERGAVILGRVLTAEGSPVAGAFVEVRGGRSYAESRTDGEGLFRMSGAEPGERSVSAVHPEHGHGDRTIEVQPGENRVDLTLQPREGRTLRGRVVGPDGEPMEGALVDVQGDPFHPGWATTLGDGSFTLRVGGSGSFELLATKPGYAPARLDDWAVAGATDGLELRLGRTSSLSGRVLGVAPEDLPRVEVLAMDEHFLERSGFIDPEGVYRLLELSPGRWAVSARLGGRTAEARVQIRPGEEAVLDLPLPRVSPVSGRVLGAEGEPVAGALVKLTSATAEAGVGTDKDGSFTIFAEDGTYLLVAHQTGHPVTRLDEPVTVDGAPVEGLEIRLAQGASVSGRILGLPEGADRPVNVWAQVGRFRHFGSARDGTYHIGPLASGEWQVTAQFGANRVDRRVTIAPGEESVELDLPLSPGSHTLSGRVDAYRALENGTVQLQRADDPEAMARAQLDEGGAFRIDHLPPGRYLLTVREGYVNALLTRELDLSADVELVIPLGKQP